MRVISAKSRDRGVHHGRIGLSNRVVVEAKLFQTAGFEVFDNDVGAGGKFLGKGAVVFVFEVQDYVVFVAICTQEVGFFALVDWWAPSACFITREALNFDDGCTQVRKQHCGVRAR